MENGTQAHHLLPQLKSQNKVYYLNLEFNAQEN